MEELNDRISELEDLLEQKKMRISNDSKGINSINTRNRQLNIALNSIYGAKNFEEEDENDPFSRRKTESTLIFHPEDSKRASSTKTAKKETSNTFKTFNIWEEFDFEINVDLEKSDQAAPPTVKPVYYVPDPNLSYTTSKIPSKKISFAEYKQRKGR